jgi:monoamine oxidase
MIEQSLGIPQGSLHLISIKDFYWKVGTHYYSPLQKPFRSRDEFLDKIQHPQKGMLVVGEAVSRYQGWTEGALESVKTVLTKKWIKDVS